MSEKKITEVKIEPGCTSCGLCAFVAPELFEITDTAQVKKGVDPNLYADAVRDAVRGCPVRVIKLKEEEL